MGFLDRLKALGGGVDQELLQNGRLGRGILLGVQQTNVSTGSDAFPSPVCIFTVQVLLDKTAPYEVQIRQAVPLTSLASLVPGQTVFAVRVDPADPARAALDLATPPPTVVATETDGAPKAADVLSTGEPVKAVIVQAQPLGMKSPEGHDVYALVLTVMREHEAPYQVQVGNAVPANAVPLVYPGSAVPAKVAPDNREALVVDWAAALAAASA
jgi:hypothetical protein